MNDSFFAQEFINPFRRIAGACGQAEIIASSTMSIRSSGEDGAKSFVKNRHGSVFFTAAVSEEKMAARRG